MVEEGSKFILKLVAFISFKVYMLLCMSLSDIRKTQNKPATDKAKPLKVNVLSVRRKCK